MSQCDVRPSPGDEPYASTSKTPPSVSFALRGRSISSTIAAAASGSRQRTGDSSTPRNPPAEVVAASGARHRADLHDVAADLDAELPRRSAFATAPAATRAAVSRALARSSTSRTS